MVVHFALVEYMLMRPSPVLSIPLLRHSLGVPTPSSLPPSADYCWRLPILAHSLTVLQSRVTYDHSARGPFVVDEHLEF